MTRPVIGAGGEKVAGGAGPATGAPTMDHPARGERASPGRPCRGGWVEPTRPERKLGPSA